MRPINLKIVLAIAFLTGFLSSLLVAALKIQDVTILYAGVAFAVWGFLRLFALENNHLVLFSVVAIAHGGVAMSLATAIYWAVRSRSKRTAYISFGIGTAVFLLIMFVLGDPGELP
jgi:hypothetical protein